MFNERTNLTQGRIQLHQQGRALNFTANLQAERRQQRTLGHKLDSLLRVVKVSYLLCTDDHQRRDPKSYQQ